MSEITKPVMLDETGRKIADRLREIRNIMKKEGSTGVVFGFHIDSSESDPAEAVTYIGDAVGMTPASMNYTRGLFNWGSWENAFFMPRPCMLKYDGTVDYYLDPNNYGLKEDGETASDVANDAYEGNAMMEWGQDGSIIWYKIVPDALDDTSCSVYIADHQEDDDFHAWSFINSRGQLVDHFYTPIYNGWYDGTRMRSISGKTPTASLNATVERNYCRANGETMWDTEVYCDNILITLLLTLVGKSLNTQAVFGQGNTTSGQAGVLATGTGDDKGLFYGSSGTTSVVKVFGMENFWGNLWRRFGGLVNVNGTQKYKLTRGTEDGSGFDDYVVSNTAAAYDGYLVGGSLPAASGTYLQRMTWDENQWCPKEVAGNDHTFYSDGLWTNNNQVNYAFRGGYSADSALCGAWYLVLSDASSRASWDIAAAPSCKPLS